MGEGDSKSTMEPSMCSVKTCFIVELSIKGPSRPVLLVEPSMGESQGLFYCGALYGRVSMPVLL